VGELPIYLNRLGNEYFLKFLALINIIIAENGLPRSYAGLSVTFLFALRNLMPYLTLSHPISRSEQTMSEFVDEEK